MKLLTKKFFERPVLEVAPELLGKYLVRKIDKKSPILRGLPKALKAKLSSKGGGRFMITDVEAYDGPQDKASHARFGLTTRNAPMFEHGGVWYVYFTYGMHWLLNIVCGKKGRPAAILIRGVEGISGPARITKALKIDKKFNSKVALPETGLWIEQNPEIENCKSARTNVHSDGLKIKNSPRIGVGYAGPVWSKKKWRLFL